MDPQTFFQQTQAAQAQAQASFQQAAAQSELTGLLFFAGFWLVILAVVVGVVIAWYRLSMRKLELVEQLTEPGGEALRGLAHMLEAQAGRMQQLPPAAGPVVPGALGPGDVRGQFSVSQLGGRPAAGPRPSSTPTSGYSHHQRHSQRLLQRAKNAELAAYVEQGNREWAREALRQGASPAPTKSDPFSF